MLLHLGKAAYTVPNHDDRTPHGCTLCHGEATRHPMSRVCEVAGVDPTTPSRWKRGLTRPTADKLFDLQVALSRLVDEAKPTTTGRAA